MVKANSTEKELGEAPKKPEKKEKRVDAEQLFQEIDLFLERVEDGLYAAPNRIVPKAQRSKWRFAGKHWYEDLPAIPQERPDYGAAAEYLR